MDRVWWRSIQTSPPISPAAKHGPRTSVLSPRSWRFSPANQHNPPRPCRSGCAEVGIASYLRRRITAPLVQRIDMQGELLLEMHLRQLFATAPYSDPKRLERYGFRAFSQNDEDGILQEILRRVG